MAKKTKKKDTELAEENSQLTVYTHLDVTNRDIKSINIEKLIRIIRGQKVMLDSDLAMLYGVENKRLNEQVKRNINRFPEDFMFQLETKEWNLLKSQFATTKHTDNEPLNNLKSQFATSSWGGSRKRPFVFTRNGIGMLSSVLRSETETDEKVNQIITTIEKRLPEQLPEQVFATGCVWDAWTYVSDLVRSAKQRIVLIDNFVDDRVLSLLDKRADNVEATIHSRYYESFQTDLKKHNEQYREIQFVQLPHRNHDRFLIIDDDDVYLLGASVKDMGVGMCAVTKMQVSPETILGLLK